MNTNRQLPAGFRLEALPPRTFAGHPSGAGPRSDEEYERLLTEIQRLRGAVYVEDGAIPHAALDTLGRHRVQADFDHWHLLTRNEEGGISACLRLRLHDTNVQPGQLMVFEFVERMPSHRAAEYRSAIDEFLANARHERTSVGEAGGWAVSPSSRRCPSTMFLPLAAWSMFHVIGNATVLSAASTRHQSARVLKKFGGFPLCHRSLPLTRFYDPCYRCDMEIVAYDSRRPSPTYVPIVEQIKSQISRLGYVAERRAGCAD